MKTLVISDIHANQPALEAVLNAALPCDRIVFLGDLANFGPHPAECVQLLRQHNPICILGNHDEEIASDAPKHFWDAWSKKQLSDDQIEWIRSFCPYNILDGHILLLHGAYSVEYDLLPNTSDHDIAEAFKEYLTPEIDQVWFGHYHYQIDRIINGVEYHCIRPVGHHRDKDTSASYYLYENGKLEQKRTRYALDKTIADFNALQIFRDSKKKYLFTDLLENAYSEELLKKDICQMQRNAAASK